MKRIITLFMSALLLVLTGCRFDDDDILRRLDEQEERIERLEARVARINGEIHAVGQIVNVLMEGNWITHVTALDDGSGYRISLNRGEPIVIRNGEDGLDGQTPDIGILAVNGVYYWTLNGDFLTGDNGERLPVTGDATAPQVRINDDTMEWEISTDNGAVWTSTGVDAVGPAGQDGDSLFRNIEAEGTEFVVFTLADGTVFRVPRADDFGLAFTGITKGEFRLPSDGQTSSFSYTVIGDITGIGIANAIPQGWVVSVDRINSRINVSSMSAGSIQILVVGNSSDGESVTYWLTLIAYGVDVQALIDDAVANGGGTVLLEPSYTYSVGTGITIPAGVIVQGDDGTVLGFPSAVDGNAVTINGGTLRNVTVRYIPDRTPGAAWNNNPTGVAFAIGGAGGFLENSTVVGFRNGVYANNTAEVYVLNNTIEANRTGIQFANRVGATVGGNNIRNNETIGFLLQFLTADTDRGTLTISNNTFFENWYSDMENRWATEYVINLNSNTFTTTPPTLRVAPGSGEAGSNVDFTKPTPAPNTASIVTRVRTNVVIDNVSEITP